MDDFDPFRVEISKADLLYAMRHDCVTFLSFYLGSELTLEVPDFHETIWDEILLQLQESNLPAVSRSLRKLFAVPREHSKSTLAKLAVILFLLYSPFIFAMYVSKTNAIAKNAVRDILMWLQSDQHRELHGPVVLVKSSETDSLWILDLSIRLNEFDPPKTKRCILKALGSDSQVRGSLIMNRRPEIVIVDDIEDLDNIANANQQATLDAWFMGSLMKSLSRSHFILFIGNMIRKTSLLARLSKNPLWNPTVFGALVRDRTTGKLRALWEGRWTVESLLADYAEYRLTGQGHIWEAEMMNLTQDEVLQQDLSGIVCVPLPNPEDLIGGVIILDPAFGQHTWNDDSAITVHARIEGVPVPVLIDSWHGKATEDQLFDKMLEFSYTWGITTWGIEADAAQKLFIPYFNLLMVSRKLNQDAILVLPLLSARTSKDSRIVAYRRSIAGNSYGITDSQIEVVERLQQYVPGSKDRDDLIDSAAYGLICWDIYGELVTSRGIQQVAMIIFKESLAAYVLQGIQVA